MVSGVRGTRVTIKRMKTVADVSQVLHWLRRSIILLIPIAILLPLAPWIWLVWPIYAAFAFLTATVLAVMIVPLQMALPLGVQGRAIGVFTLVVTGVAESLGPLLTGAITQGSGLPLGITILLLGLGGACGAALLIRRRSEEHTSELQSLMRISYLVFC